MEVGEPTCSLQVFKKLKRKIVAISAFLRPYRARYKGIIWLFKRLNWGMGILGQLTGFFRVFF
jgi:hypothetical protein